jgi:hypothetical protein
MKKTPHRRPRHKESPEQRALITWAHFVIVPDPPHPEKTKLIDYLFAIPNGGRRDKREAALMKAEGVKAGVSDLFLPIPRGGYCGFWIELKPTDGTGRLSAAQSDWLILMASCNYRAFCAVGWMEAKRAIIEYLVEDTP